MEDSNIEKLQILDSLILDLFKIIMAQIMVNHYNYYQQRIQFLRANGDVLLQRIKMFETNMNRRKQQNQQPLVQNLNSLNAMVKKLLQMLAEIYTCQYFQLTYERFDYAYFTRICSSYFENLLHEFIVKLRMKRIHRLQNLQHLQQLRHLQSSVDEIIHPIDFQIM